MITRRNRRSGGKIHNPAKRGGLLQDQKYRVAVIVAQFVAAHRAGAHPHGVLNAQKGFIFVARRSRIVPLIAGIDE